MSKMKIDDCQECAEDFQADLLQTMRKSIAIVTGILEDKNEKSETRISAAFTITKMCAATTEILENIRKAKEDDFII